MSQARWRMAALLAASSLMVGAPGTWAQSAKTRPRAEGDLPTPLPLEEESEHVVVPGETLGGIAHRAKVPKILIIEANHLKAPHYAVHAGQKLFLPRTRHHTVKAGETGFDIAYRYGVSYASIAVANGLEPDARLREGQKLLIPTVLKPENAAKAEAKADKTAPAAEKAKDKEQQPKADARPGFLWPMEGVMRRGFVAKTRNEGGGDFHNGLDIVAPEGQTVRTSAPGEVIFAGREPDSFGNLVVIDHGKGWQTAYGFLSKLTVKRGDSVKAHERVGLVGHSGRATRDELHFEIRHDDEPVNPLPLLPRRAAAKGEKKADAAPVGKPSPKPAPDHKADAKADGGKKGEGKLPGKPAATGKQAAARKQAPAGKSER